MGPDSSAARADITIEDVFDFLQDLPGLPSPKHAGQIKQLSRQSSVDSIQNGLLAEATRQAITSAMDDSPLFPSHQNSFTSALAGTPSATAEPHMIMGVPSSFAEGARVAPGAAGQLNSRELNVALNGSLGLHVGEHVAVPGLAPSAESSAISLQDAARLGLLPTTSGLTIPAGSSEALLRQQQAQLAVLQQQVQAQLAQHGASQEATARAGADAVASTDALRLNGLDMPGAGLVPQSAMSSAAGLLGVNGLGTLDGLVAASKDSLALNATSGIGASGRVNIAKDANLIGDHAVRGASSAFSDGRIPTPIGMNVPLVGQAGGMTAGLVPASDTAAALTAAAGARDDARLAKSARKTMRHAPVANGFLGSGSANTAPTVVSSKQSTKASSMGNSASGDRRHMCSWPNCGKAFGSKWGLGRHYRIHTGDKPWVCTIEGCGKRFVDRTLLQRHENTHSSARPFACPRPGCDKAFKVSKHLEYHLRLHDKPDSFACGIDGCEKYFATPSSLRMHRLLDHGRPEEESAAEKQLRADAQTAAEALDQVKQQLSEEQAKVKAANLESRQQRELARAREQLLQALRHENAQLTEALQAQPANGHLANGRLEDQCLSIDLGARHLWTQATPESAALADASLAQLFATQSTSANASLPLTGLPSNIVLNALGDADGGFARRMGGSVY